jgi:hypothetical protein
LNRLPCSRSLRRPTCLACWRVLKHSFPHEHKGLRESRKVSRPGDTGPAHIELPDIAVKCAAQYCEQLITIDLDGIVTWSIQKSIGKL